MWTQRNWGAPIQISATSHSPFLLSISGVKKYPATDLAQRSFVLRLSKAPVSKMIPSFCQPGGPILAVVNVISVFPNIAR